MVKISVKISEAKLATASQVGDWGCCSALYTVGTLSPLGAESEVQRAQHPPIILPCGAKEPILLFNKANY